MSKLEMLMSATSTDFLGKRQRMRLFATFCAGDWLIYRVYMPRGSHIFSEHESNKKGAGHRCNDNYGTCGKTLCNGNVKKAKEHVFRIFVLAQYH